MNDAKSTSASVVVESPPSEVGEEKPFTITVWPPPLPVIWIIALEVVPVNVQNRTAYPLISSIPVWVPTPTRPQPGDVPDSSMCSMCRELMVTFPTSATCSGTALKHSPCSMFSTSIVASS